jgi:hypothetical protein
MIGKRILVELVAVVAFAGCASMPTGPSVMVLPPPGKPFEQFQADDFACRQWAFQQAGGDPAAIANQNMAGAAVAGTAIGAGLGAAIGAASGNPGTGAAIGAASGLLGGTAVGANAGYASGWEMQRRYDIGYQQCMYAKGNQIPGVVHSPSRRYNVPPPPPGYGSPASPTPPPASGSPPPGAPPQ